MRQKEKKLFLEQDAIKTTNTSEKGEVETGKDMVVLIVGCAACSLPLVVLFPSLT